MLKFDRKPRQWAAHASAPTSTLPRHAHTPPVIERASSAGQRAGASFAQEAKGTLVQRKADPANVHDVASAPSIVTQVVGGSGRRLDAGVRANFETMFGFDFSQVRVHTDARAAASARAIDALAYTVGQNIVFGAGQYAPESRAGKQLLAHELTHVVQQSRGVTPHRASVDVALEADADKAGIAAGSDNNPVTARATGGYANDCVSKAAHGSSRFAAIQSKADPAAVASLAPAEILAHPDYIDNGLARMSFYGAEEADLFYNDGAMVRIGLVPRWIKAPFKSVDYHTSRTQMAEVKDDPHTLKFVSNLKAIPRDTPYSDVITKHAKTVSFTVDDASGKIIPDHVNPITAPFLCRYLLKAEAEYVANFDAMAKGMVKVFEAMKLIIELQLLRATLPAGRATKVPRAVGAAGAGAEAFDAAAVAEQLYVATKAAANPAARMLAAATRLSGMAELTGAQKVPTILEFFKRIGFAIGKEGVKDAGEFFVMKSEGGFYAFRILKDTGRILYGKMDLAKLDYIWRAL
jgi:hypothetical protein